MRKIAAVLFTFAMLVLGLSGCSAMVEVQEAQQTIIVNEDLSGSIQIGVAYTTSDFALLQNSYDIISLTSSQLAEVTGWQVYETDSYQESGYQWVTISHTFNSVDEFYSLISAGSLVSDTTTGAGGSAGGNQYPAMSLEKYSGLFKTEYKFENTLIALAATNATIPTVLRVRLPGEIVSTNGRILDDGHTVEWNWGAYDYVPVTLVTETANKTGIILTLLCLSCLCAFFILVIAAAGYFLFRKKVR